MRALHFGWVIELIQRQDKHKCSALNVVVFLMLVGSVAADTKATKEMLTHSTTTQSRSQRGTRSTSNCCV